MLFLFGACLCPDTLPRGVQLERLVDNVPCHLLRHMQKLVGYTFNVSGSLLNYNGDVMVTCSSG